MSKMFSYLKPFKKKIIISIILIFIVSMIQCLIPLFEGKYIFEYIMKSTQESKNEINYTRCIILYLSISFILYFLCALGKFIYNKFLIVVNHQSIKNIRQDIYKKIHKLPIKYFDQNTVGNIMDKITNNIDIISNGMQQISSSFIYSFFHITMLLVCMFWIDWHLGFIISLMIPFSFIIIFFVNKKSRNIFIQRFNKTSEYNGFLQEKFTGHKEVILYNQQDNSIKEFQKINKDLSKLIFKSNFLSSLTFPIVNSFTYFILAIIIIIGKILLYGTSFDLHNSHIYNILIKLGFVCIRLGVFQAFIQYVWRLSSPINDLCHMFVIIQSIKTAFYKILEFLCEYEEKENLDAIVLDKVEGYVSFNNVCFGYQKDKFIIKNMNLFVPKKKTIAIVGSTGSGKTTLINLLTRFYDVDEGYINIDGINIKNLKKENLRQIVGLVLQDVWLFKGTILENIKYSNPDKTDEEVIEMAKKTQLHDFIISKEKGYKTFIDEELNNLSQGEKQLIAITRTLLRDPSILILDEATSTIDTQIELVLQQSIKKILQNKTAFVIAHRLSTIINADLIIFLQKGEIIEQGNHIELLNKRGFYYNLYQSQFQK